MKNQLEKIEILVDNPKLDGLKILHLSDLHINKRTTPNQIEDLVSFCNSLDFDFCVITGDIIDAKMKFIEKKVEILNKLNGLVYYISGNHDLFYGLKDLKKVLNLIFMDNNFAQIEYKNELINLVGLGDRFSKYFGIKREIEKISNFLKKEPSILISHQPKDYKIAIENNAQLFLCGHTHGGQIFPFHFLVKLVQPFVSGLFYKKNTAIYVNRGFGTWGIDFRYKANSEITLITLVSKGV